MHSVTNELKRSQGLPSILYNIYHYGSLDSGSHTFGSIGIGIYCSSLHLKIINMVCTVKSAM